MTVVNPALGSDLSGTADLTPQMAECAGRQCLAENLARRLITQRGTLIDDANYGYDLTGVVNDDLAQSDVPRIAANVSAELAKDERVLSVVVTAQLVGVTQVDAAKAGTVANPSPGSEGVLVIKATVTDSLGPFVLVLAASAVTVTILEAP